jgi:hypothetical protein
MNKIKDPISFFPMNIEYGFPVKKGAFEMCTAIFGAVVCSVTFRAF